MPVSTKKLKARERDLHKRLVEAYQRRYEASFAKPYYDYWNSRLLRHVSPGPVRRVLECGCGPGRFTTVLADRFPTAAGLDLSLEMMIAGRGRDNPGPPLMVGDMEDLPLAEETLDAIFSRGALHHLPEPARAVAEWFRTLRPGGWVVVSEPCNDGFLLPLARRVMVPRMNHFEATHKAFTSVELTNLLTRAGLRVVAKEKFGFVGFPLCALSDLLPLLHYLPARDALARGLVRLDAWCAFIPGIRRESWHCIIAARKPDGSGLLDRPHKDPDHG